MQNRSPSKTEPTRQMPSTPQNVRPQQSAGENEGEGNRTADREYREHVSRHVKSGKSEPAAEDARRALEGDEADDLREAELEGKAGGGQPMRGQPGQREDQRAREDQGNRDQRR